MKTITKQPAAKKTAKKTTKKKYKYVKKSAKSETEKLILEFSKKLLKKDLVNAQKTVAEIKRKIKNLK